ncbi:MAG TPA: transglutaminase family protein [Bryobacteraceae bacterium]|nr:transglutaminase family protein [Bryobacteraceae bacterium]
MTYRTIHTTTYRYEEPVAQSVSEARLTPRITDRQQVIESKITLEPAFAKSEARIDYFGNEVTTIAIFGAHDRFVVTAASIVETGLVPLAEPPEISWETVRDQLASPADPDALAASEFAFESPFVPAVRSVAEFARMTFPAERPIAETLRDLNARVHREFVYKPAATSIEVPLQEVMEKRHGVCQDFAHVMIGALRSVGLAARYVSGYLRSGSNVQGAEASHAWVSVWIPGAGWVDFDPTNNVMPNDGHVTVGWGRDYGDVTPVKGIAMGGGGQTVEVEVHVTPIEVAAK